MLKKWLAVIGLVFLAWNVDAQNTTLSFKATNEPITEALDRFAAATGLTLAYSPSFFSTNKTVSLDIKDSQALDVLPKILAGTGITFRRLRGRRVVLTKIKLTYHTISGYVQDESNQERLFGATLFSTAAGKGTSTNEYGFFSLSLPAGTHQIEINYLGYATASFELDLSQDLVKNVDLKAGLTMKAIVITPDEKLSALAKSKQGMYQMDQRAMKKAPRVGGVNDLVGATSMIPGFVNSQEGLGGLHVRGGSTGQNQMLMDGVPIYIPYHLLGLFSVYNSRVVQTAKLYKGAFASRYGGSISSIFDVRIKEGNKTRWSADAGMNLIMGDLLVQGPIFKGKGSVLAAARTSVDFRLLNDYFDRVYQDGHPGDLTSGFDDFNFKVNYSINENNHLYLSRYNGSDDFGRVFEFEVEDEFEESEIEFESRFRWRNAVTSLRWTHEFSSRAFVNTTFISSNYSNEYRLLEENSLLGNYFYLENIIDNSEIGLKVDLDFAQSESHHFRAGLGFNIRSFDSGLNSFDSQNTVIEGDTLDELEIDDFVNLGDRDLYTTNEGFAYIEDQFRIKDNWTVVWGMRASGYLNEKDSQFHLEPRVTSSVRLDQQFTWNFSSSKMVQYLHLVNNGVVRLPSDIWIPVRGDIKPQVAWHWEMGLDFDMDARSSLSLDLYLKKMTNLYNLPETASFLGETDQVSTSELVSRGKGDSKGIELFYNWNGVRKSFTAAYSLSKSTRQFEDQNGGLPYSYEYDHRHSLNLTGSLELNENITVNAAFQYFSGGPKLFVYESLLRESTGNITTTPGTRNLERGQSYQRLDLSANFKKQFKRFGHEVALGVTNVMGRKNVAYYLSSDLGQTPVHSIALQPSFSYRITY